MSECKLTGFQQVLVRDSVEDKWRRQFFDYYDETSGFPYRCIGNGFKCCIPYEGNEHLADTSDPYVEPKKVKMFEDYYARGEFITSKQGSIFICSGLKGQHNRDLRVGVIALLSSRGKGLEIFKKGDWQYKRYLDEKRDWRKSAEEEKKLFLSNLKRIGKDWDAEKKEIVDYIEHYYPKNGDFVYAEGYHNHLFIFSKVADNMIYAYAELFNERDLNLNEGIGLIENFKTIRPATEEEKNLLLSKLHEAGKDWDAEKKEIVDWKWMPKEGETFYSPSFDPIENAFYVDSFIWKGPNGRCHNLLDMGRVFKTEEKCEPLCNKLNAAIKNVK